ncbi:bifunctional helix-turn-helix transcriptional regulator/GNAT family N-acetyltransferase [Mucilaginibacter aquaedulcis]|uniref:bifunctional helix-turn-helix transcriptional regulator/GNAT family N-acetyltransferase n=1 Tax=Mucilaginibacter aquaedulcis TaxID=1187081 RepID=UPI0025B5291F|nr:helix-turn-helix domain-containing GNAT family N-acetyltransferase [Mucilaginibacter aquaedulcis]MDN3546867.1 helix-turn-helix domain-containing GNAT family N-acetyltransferase [Mucilaginibacter aquaedulcis]
MNIIDQLEELAIGARLKRLYDYFAKDVVMIYKDEQLNFEPKYFTLYYLISRQGEAGVTEIAEELSLTHPGVIHLAKELEALGFIESVKSSKDSRRRMLRLSAKGKESLPKFERVWAKIVALNKELFNNQKNNLLNAVMETEAQLNEKPYYQRFQEMFNPQGNSPVKVITYQPQYARYFKNLNIEWINTYFTVEEHDLEQLNHPEEHILADGGEILFAQINDDIAGTCALVKTGPAEYELAKMAVSPKYQGRKIGNLLMEAAIAKAKELGGTRLWLGSSHKLVPALSLYRKYGFKEFTVESTPYQRASIHMERSLIE